MIPCASAGWNKFRLFKTVLQSWMKWDEMRWDEHKAHGKPQLIAWGSDATLAITNYLYKPEVHFLNIFSPLRAAHCFFWKRHPLLRQGTPTSIRKTGSASSEPGRGFVRPPVSPTPPTISSTYGGASGDQLTDCWHQMNSYGQCILFFYPCIVCRMLSVSELMGAVQIYLCLSLTKLIA